MTPSEQALSEGLLFTDLYQLTMAQPYVEEGLADTPAQFDAFYRDEPDYGRHKAGYCVFAGLGDRLELHHPSETAHRTLEPGSVMRLESLLATVWRQGTRSAERAGIDELRARREHDEARLDPGVRRLLNPHIYHASLSARLRELKRRLLAEVAGS